MAKTKKESNGNGANLGCEQTLWAAADKMRGHMDAAEYKHVALGLIFLKYISDAFQELFVEKKGKGSGEFYTPQSVVKLLVAMIELYKGRIYDPCCGSGGMFVQSEKFIEAHGGRKGDIAIYGQESNPTTRHLCLMNLAIRGIDGNIGDRQADSFTNDLHKDLKADYILANPPFNISDWWNNSLSDDVRWQYGTPPKGNANYGWVQRMIHYLMMNKAVELRFFSRKIFQPIYVEVSKGYSTNFSFHC